MLIQAYSQYLVLLLLLLHKCLCLGECGGAVSGQNGSPDDLFFYLLLPFVVGAVQECLTVVELKINHVNDQRGEQGKGDKGNNPVGSSDCGARDLLLSVLRFSARGLRCLAVSVCDSAPAVGTAAPAGTAAVGIPDLCSSAVSEAAGLFVFSLVFLPQVLRPRPFS